MNITDTLAMIIWDAFLDVYGVTITQLSSVCKRWHRTLTNINTMVVPTTGNKKMMRRTYLALRLNRVPIAARTITQHFIDIRPEQKHAIRLYQCLLFLYCKKTWQHMPIPTQADIYQYHKGGHAKLINQCKTIDALVDLYKIIPISDFVTVLCHMVVMVQQNRFSLKHLNWLIKSLDKRKIEPGILYGVVISCIHHS